MLAIQAIQKNYDRFCLNCSMEVKDGHITGLIGQNGAGKSTTFKSILGLIQVDSGKIELFGKNVKNLSEADKQQIGVVLSDSGFSGYMTIKDVATVLGYFYRQFDKVEFFKQCEHFHLPIDKEIRTFSTGMKAKLKVLVAISHKPKFLLLDEPTAGLDVLARDEVLDMLRDFMEEDETRSILISSHISSDLESICDDFYMIHDGTILLHEETDVLLSDYGILKVDDEQFTTLDRQYLLKVKKEKWGYRCLTNQRQFYLENYPKIVLEKGSIDELIFMMIRGENV